MKPPIVLYEAPRRLRTDYRIGLSAWTDRSMLEESQFYPRKTMTAEERLWWYSRFFDVVEVNSSFYAIPSVETVTSWVARTPAGFLFNVKAHGVLTGHHADAARLSEALRKLLPKDLRSRAAGRVPNSAFGPEARRRALDELGTAIAPLRQAGKLGYVLFQLAPCVRLSEAAVEDLAALPRQLPGVDIAVELRSRTWFGANTDATLSFLCDHGLAYVSIDGPRSRATVPSLPALTAATAVFRLHGRNFEGFLKQVQGKAPTVAEKYDYLYTKDELEEVARAAGALSGKAARVHVAMNNNRRDYPIINAIQLKEMLFENWHSPDRGALVEELEDRRASAKAGKKPRRPPRKRAA